MVLVTIALTVLAAGSTMMFSGALAPGGVAGDLVAVVTALSLMVSICALESADA